jgi:pimeloyl-ACP methyl ester carboxylesterase
MLAVHTLLPEEPTARPPVVLVHGAANSATVWTFWQRALADTGYTSHAVDLRGHGASAAVDLSTTTMAEYADDVARVVTDLPRPCVLMGWSMGGLIAMMAAQRAGAVAVVGLAPSTPASAVDPAKILSPGEYRADYYGITSDDPDDQPAMPDLDRGERLIALSSLSVESAYARSERARGIVVESLPCPLLVVTGTADRQWPRSRYDGLHLPAEFVAVEGASHWGLVLSQRALRDLAPNVIAWVGKIR